MQRISVTLPDKIAETLHHKVSKGERSQFVARAIEDALNKDKKRVAYQVLEDFVPYDVDQSSVDVLRDIRQLRAITKGGKIN